MPSDTVSRWRAVPGFEDHYEACEDGRIRSVPRLVRFRNRWGKKTLRFHKGVELRPLPHTSRYIRVSFWKAGRMYQFYWHYVILFTFRYQPSSRHQVRHLNGKPRDNRLLNLAWGTPRQNQADRRTHGTSHGREGYKHKKLSWAKVTAIRSSWAKTQNITETARLFSMPRTSVADVVRKRTWKKHR